MFFPGQLSQVIALFHHTKKTRNFSIFFSVLMSPKEKDVNLFFPTGCNHAQDPKGWYSLNRSHVISNVLQEWFSLSISLLWCNLFFLLGIPQPLLLISWSSEQILAWNNLVENCYGKEKGATLQKAFVIWLNFPTNRQCNKCSWSFPNYLLRRKKNGKGDWTTIQI